MNLQGTQSQEMQASQKIENLENYLAKAPYIENKITLTGTLTKKSSKSHQGIQATAGKKKEKVDSRTLDEWEYEIMEIVQARTDRLRKKIKSPRKKTRFIGPRLQRIPR